MKKAINGDHLRIHYTTKLVDGTVIDTSEGKQTLDFELGARFVIKGVDDCLLGMEPNEKKTVRITADDAYGPYRDELLLTVPRATFPDSFVPEAGKELTMRTQDGAMFPVRISRFDADAIVFDANHPLAGKELEFDVHLIEIVDEKVTG
jgi:peptidylprolyl isomerase